MGGEGKFQAEARAGRDRELGSPGNVKLVQPETVSGGRIQR